VELETQAQEIDGTPATDALVDLLGDVVISVRKSLGDGKFDWSDAGFFMPLIPKIPMVAEQFPKVFPEIKDLDTAEGIALLAKVAAKAGEVDNSEKVRLIVEGVAQIALGGMKIVSGLKA
jgi:hypothetical protein